jgi:uroporphyrinogen-III synthase
MKAGGPLAGRTIVVTRPLAQAAGLASAIEADGGYALRFPLLDISPSPEPLALVEALRALADYRLVIFISPNAVAHAWPAIVAAGGWPPGVLPAAVGQGTRRALLAHGLTQCLAPTQRFDSEALLDLPELAAGAVAGARILILRGDGGRELLGDSLRQRGAEVDLLSCYCRSGPPQDSAVLLDAWRAGRLSAISLSSSEGLRYLHAGLDSEGLGFLRATPLFVSHPRIADNARQMGLTRIILTAAGDEGMLAGLRAYNWSA